MRRWASNAGFLTVPTSTIHRNAAAPGGGIHYDHGTMNVSSSTVSGRSAPISGGGVFNFGTFGMAGPGAATIVGSTISDHAAAHEEMTSAQAIAVDRPDAQQIERARSPIRDGISSREETETATFILPDDAIADWFAARGGRDRDADAWPSDWMSDSTAVEAPPLVVPSSVAASAIFAGCDAAFASLADRLL